MSKNDSGKGFFDREYTRRQFLKLSGKSLVGVALSGSLLGLLGCTQKEIDEKQVETMPTPKGLLVLNRAKCVGCQRCEMNCTVVNDGKVAPRLARLRLTPSMYFGVEDEVPEKYIDGEGMYGDYRWGPKTCRQCADPWCANACPVGAIYADETTGARVVDEEKCIACGACVEACPWHMPIIDPEINKSTKCINCGACVAGCPTGALQMIDWKDIAKAADNSGN